jgi:hypothetical protein
MERHHAPSEFVLLPLPAALLLFGAADLGACRPKFTVPLPDGVWGLSFAFGGDDLDGVDVMPPEFHTQLLPPRPPVVREA